MRNNRRQSRKPLFPVYENRETGQKGTLFNLHALPDVSINVLSGSSTDVKSK